MIFPEVKKLKKSLNDSIDIVIRELSCGESEINIIYIKSMINDDLFVSGVLGPLIDFGSSLSEY